VVYSSHNVESDRIQRIYPLLPQKVQAALNRWDHTVPAKCDFVATVSQNDKDRFIELGVQSDNISVVPNGIDLAKFDAHPATSFHSLYHLPKSTKVLVFHGAASYPPNASAIKFLASELLPQLSKKGWQVALVIVGKSPIDYVQQENVFFTGFVESVAPFLKGADLAICPLLSGGGTRLKILEYFAANIPVVATPSAVEGLPVSDKNHYILAERSEMISTLCHLFENPNSTREMSNAARCFVQHYDWNSLVESQPSLG
jgi:glycosyltransferase involved in cell wall biosynthesis